MKGYKYSFNKNFPFYLESYYLFNYKGWNFLIYIFYSSLFYSGNLIINLLLKLLFEFSYEKIAD